MIPAKIVGATMNFGAPKNWDAEKNGECADLPVRIVEHDGLSGCQSAWRPSRQELDMLISGAAIVVTLYCRQPVMAMHVEKVEQ